MVKKCEMKVKKVKKKHTEQQKRCCVKQHTAVLIHFKHMCYRSWRQSDSRKRIIHLMLIYCTRGAYASRRHVDLKSSLIRTVIAMWKRFRSLWDFLELDENSSYNSYKTTVSQGHTWLLFMHRIVFVDGMVYCVHDRLQWFLWCNHVFFFSAVQPEGLNTTCT